MKSIINLSEKIEAANQRGSADSMIFTYIFSQIRITLEKTNTKKNYPILSMVCNWYLHDKIEKSVAGFTILKNVSDVFYDDFHNNYRDNDKLMAEHIRKISDAFNIHKLQIELLDFFKKHNVNPVMANDRNWDTTIIFVLNDLAQKPIVLPDIPDLPSKKLNNMQRRAKQTFQYLEKRAQETFPEQPELIIPSCLSVELTDEKAFVLNLVMRSNIQITIPILHKRKSNT